MALTLFDVPDLTSPAQIAWRLTELADHAQRAGMPFVARQIADLAKTLAAAGRPEAA